MRSIARCAWNQEDNPMAKKGSKGKKDKGKKEKQGTA